MPWVRILFSCLDHGFKFTWSEEDQNLVESEEAMEGRAAETKPSRSLSFVSVLILGLGKLVLEGKDPFTVWGWGWEDGSDGTFEWLSY